MKGGREEAALAMLHDLWSATIAQSHDGSLHRHSFREHKPKRLLEARKREDVAGRQQQRDVRALAGEHDVLLDAEFARVLLEHLSRATVGGVI